MPIYKSPYFVPATALMLLAGAFTFNANGASWLWASQPVAAAVLLATSGVFWVLLSVSRKGRRGRV
jgi:hypothetical protein